MRNSYPRLDPEWLITFLNVAECGGVLAASRAMHISQPALSARLRRLEDALGQVLFDRSAQGMALTVAGKRLLPTARKLPKVLREAVEAVDPTAATRLAGPLRLSASTTLADFVLPPLLAEYARLNNVSGLNCASETPTRCSARCAAVGSRWASWRDLGEPPVCIWNPSPMMKSFPFTRRINSRRRYEIN